MRVEDWISRFVKLRRAVGISFPGYMIHEAVHWSDVHKKWFFLPRYASKEPYNAATAYETGDIGYFSFYNNNNIGCRSKHVTEYIRLFL